MRIRAVVDSGRLELVLLLAAVALLAFAAVVVVPLATANPPCTPIACTYNGSGQLPAPYGLAAGNITTSGVSLGWTSASTYSQGYGLTNESVFFWAGAGVGGSGFCLRSPGFGHLVGNASLLFSVPAIAAPQPATYHLTWNFTGLAAGTTYCAELNEWNGPQYGNYSKGVVFVTSGAPGSGGSGSGSSSGGSPAVNSSNLGGLFIPGSGGLPVSYAVLTYTILFVTVAAVAVFLMGHHGGGRHGS